MAKTRGLSAAELRDLAPYCTARQHQLLSAWSKMGSAAKAAHKLGLSRNALLNAKARVVAKHNHRGNFGRPETLAMNEPLPEGFVLRGQSALVDKEGNLRERWDKTRQEGADPDEVPKLPDAVLKRVAKFHDADGKVLQYWTTEEPSKVTQATVWQDFARALAEENGARWEPVSGPGSREPISHSLMPTYLVGDHHIGMLAWGEETDGDSYDTKIAESLLCKAVDHLTSVTPASDLGCVAFLGDLMHYDGLTAETPTSHHRLDPDTRYGKVVRATIRCVRYVIGRALEHHQRVKVIVMAGNHDPSSMIFLTELLACYYENEPRVEVDTSPALYRYLSYGRCLIGFHHGHQKKKLKDLPLIMATDRPEQWGESKYRYWWTGHVHHDQVLGDANGACRVESVEIMAPMDAYAYGAGFRSSRSMKAVVYHALHGEMARYTVNPEVIDHE